MPNFNALTPMFWTREVKETVAFYTEVLGFECAVQEDYWAVLVRDEIEVMLSLPNPNLPFEEPTFTGSFYINTTEVDKLWDQVKDKCNICYEIDNFEYGMREFAIYDNNNYILQFGQPITE
ncbi:VOC family protein [Flavobacterium psychrotrophum]|uniref:VOC family protein n=1 Tax=Flavobacterium psychrotrophum TaxID=2294119 RepID=UPI001F09E8DC|nr:VOC family protein [Flavobacterium psychrotrophum]